MLACVALAACGQRDGSAPGDSPQAPAGELRIVVRPGGETGPELEATLTCDPPGGTHPDPAAACAALAANEDALSDVPGHGVCTQQYGGPEEAEVTGTFHGQRVDAGFTKRNGCEIERWERLEPLFSLEG